MPITISKKAKQIMNRVDKLAGHGEKPQPPPTPKPSSTDPDTSLMFALQLFSVKGGTLMMVKKATGKCYQVRSYSPASRVIVLSPQGKDAKEFWFETTMTIDTESKYAPLWRS